MNNRLYLRLLSDGYWARMGKNKRKSPRILCFDVSLENKIGCDYSDLQEKPFIALSIRASDKVGRGTDQCFDRLVVQYHNRISKDDLYDFDNLYRIWKTYHLNDMMPGTAKQMRAIKMLHTLTTYEDICKFLNSENLYEDCGYKYGHSWLFRPIPPEDIEFLKNLCKKWREKPND